jgi:hypothetical protein
MSEYIKTGAEILDEIEDTDALFSPGLSNEEYDKMRMHVSNLTIKQWVSLSWLKEQIKERKEENEPCNCLDWILSLLEES